MSEQRERWNGVPVDSMAFGTERSDHAAAKSGARDRKLMLRFVPLKSNMAFNGGRFKSFPYTHITSVDGELDYTSFVVEFTAHRVTVTGSGLKMLVERIEDGTIRLIEQGDPMQNAAGDGAVIEEMVLEVIGED